MKIVMKKILARLLLFLIVVMPLESRAGVTLRCEGHGQDDNPTQGSFPLISWIFI